MTSLATQLWRNALLHVVEVVDLGVHAEVAGSSPVEQVAIRRTETPARIGASGELVDVAIGPPCLSPDRMRRVAVR